MKSFSFVDASIKSGIAPKHSLMIKFSSQNTIVAVYDSLDNRVVAFENIPVAVANRNNDGVMQSAILELILKDHHCKCGDAVVIIDNKVFTLVPDELFSPGDIQKYLSFTHDFQANEKTGTDAIESLATKNVYWIPSEIREFSNEHFLQHEVRHFSTFFLKFCLLKNTYPEAVYIYSSKDLLYVVVFKKNATQMCNAYEYGAQEDVVYYIMNVFQQMEFSRESTPLIISGERETMSDFKNFISNYFNHVEFTSRPSELNYCKEINQLPLYFGSVLFGAFL